MSYIFDQSIIRAYDIRGIIGKTLSTNDAYHIGRAFATQVIKNNYKVVAVGRDGRLSSPELTQYLIQGLIEGGAIAYDIGLTATPALYYASCQEGIDAGIMVTGSHNPSNYNGFKMVFNKKPFYGEDIKKLAELAKSSNYSTGTGRVVAHDISNDFVNNILATFKATGNIKVVWDTGNGAVGSLLCKITSKLPGEHIIINEEVDGNFPAHHPDPTIEKNLIQLKEEMQKHSADLGIAFDGDGDRVAAIDSSLNTVSGEKLLAIFAEDLLSRLPGSKIICDVKTSDSIIEHIRLLGGEPLLWKTGHSNIKVKMKEIGCQLAGEMSGHIFFGEGYYGFDDAIFGAVKLVNILLSSKKTLLAYNQKFPITFSTPEIKVEVCEEEKFKLIEHIKTNLIARSIAFNDLDGVRVSSASGWWLIRASNTENCLTVRAESTSENNFAKVKAELKNTLQEIAINTDVIF